MIHLDGSMGEGGGQVLRTAVGLAAALGVPVCIDHIRANRQKPGLERQHLAAVRAAAEITGAEVTGASLGATKLDFRPQAIRPGRHTFRVGSAGSSTLVFQTVLPALLAVGAPSELTLEGGTHNPWAPPYDFLARTFLPALERMGTRFETSLDRPGFYPAGGGRWHVRIMPPAKGLEPIELVERGDVRACRARAIVSNLPLHVAERELAVVRKRLGWPEEACVVEPVADPVGPGNALVLEIECEHVTEVVTAFGRRGVAAERVAEEACDEARHYLGADVPVGEHLADQLLIPFALAGGGRMRTVEPSSHTRTNIETIRRFLPISIEPSRLTDKAWQIEVRGVGG